jgi:hypothetical protein
MKTLIQILLALLAANSVVLAQQTSQNNQRLKDGLAQYPEADANKDGILTMEEARAFLQKRRDQGGGGAKEQKTTIFKPTAKELQAVIAGGGEGKSAGALKHDKGNGLRIVMTGHSWVAPGRKTLPLIASAAGFDGHQQRSHTSGGATGAANAIWLKEFGKWDDSPPLPVLVPAIATGEWDVMTWGGYIKDKEEYFTQWIDLCLKHNPEMTFFLQDGWPRFDPGFKNMEADAILGAMREGYAGSRANRQRSFYDKLEKKYPGKVHIIPAGAAVVDLIGRYYDGKVPDLDCVDEKTNGGKKGVYRDGGHLSRASGSEWLVGYIYYGMLYKKSPQLIEGLEPEGVPSRLDETMREVAWKAITSSPFSRITDKDGDGVGDREPAASGPAASSP